jgi:DNA-3-methyladenine glycosylase
VNGAVPRPERVPRSALAPPSLDVAASLLGARIVADDDRGERVAVRLTEVEAYMGSADPGSHGFRGRTRRTDVMFGPPGHLYVYFTYGMHWCANVVCGPDGAASAVLLRAGEVVEGLDLARARRPSCRRDPDLARGPARLTTALGLTGRHNGLDLCAGVTEVWLETGNRRPDDVRTGPRVGVSGAGGDARVFPWRLWLAGESSVSTYRPGKPRRRPAADSERLPLPD